MVPGSVVQALGRGNMDIKWKKIIKSKKFYSTTIYNVHLRKTKYMNNETFYINSEIHVTCIGDSGPGRGKSCPIMKMY